MVQFSRQGLAWIGPIGARALSVTLIMTIGWWSKEFPAFAQSAPRSPAIVGDRLQSRVPPAPMYAPFVSSTSSDAPFSTSDLAPDSSSLNAILELTETTAASPTQVELLFTFVETVWDSEPTEVLVQALDQAYAVIQSLEGPTVQLPLLLELATYYGDTTQRLPTDQGILLLSEASDLVNDLPSGLEQATAWQAIATQYIHWMEPSRAAMALAQAQIELEDMSVSEEKAIALTTLALNYEDIGQPDQQRILLAQSEGVLAELASLAAEPEPEPEPDDDPILTPFPWRGDLGLAGSVFAGERTTGTVTLNAAAERQWARNALDIGLRVGYSFDGDRDDADEFSGRFTIEEQYFFSERWQYFVNSGVTSDNLANLNLRAELTTGSALTLWNPNDKEQFAVRLGIGARYENLEEERTEFNPVEGSVGWTYEDLFFDVVELQQTFSINAPFTDFSDYLLRLQTDLSIPIGDRWALSNSARITWSGDPAENNPPLIFNLQSGVKYKF